MKTTNVCENQVIRYTLSKAERLNRTKSIDRLFMSGESFVAYPLRVVYLVASGEAGSAEASILVSVSKKKFKSAVKRNRVKRLIREAYRLNKNDLSSRLHDRTRRMDIAFIYLKNELPTYSEIEKGMLKSLAALSGKPEEGAPE
jgi:ribonuclease P protein component